MKVIKKEGRQEDNVASKMRVYTESFLDTIMTDLRDLHTISKERMDYPKPKKQYGNSVL